jgi:hypothetical protein
MAGGQLELRSNKQIILGPTEVKDCVTLAYVTY